MVQESPRVQFRGFTLIELLVVIAIIGLLVSILLPAVQKAREAGARSQCINNLKQQGLALQTFHDTNSYLPSGYYNSGTFSHTGWQLQLLPNLEQSGMWDQCNVYLQANPGNVDTNAFPAVNFQMKTFICPSNSRPTTTQYGGASYALTSYMGIAGTTSGTTTGDGMLFSTSQISLRDVTDGTSYTAMVGERPCTGDLYYGWGFAPFGSGYGDGDCLIGAVDVPLATSAGAPTANVGLMRPLNPLAQDRSDVAHFWSFHGVGANFLFADGSVHFLTYSANDVLPQLCTRSNADLFVMP